MAIEGQKKRTDPKIAESSGTGSSHERRKADPDIRDLTDPKEVWKDAETTPAAEGRRGASGAGNKRVADAGDIGEGQAPPYDTETQADAVGKQTLRKREPQAVEKPKR